MPRNILRESSLRTRAGGTASVHLSVRFGTLRSQTHSAKTGRQTTKGDNFERILGNSHDLDNGTLLALLGSIEK